MDITNINAYAEGYYSDSTYEENIAIRSEIFDKIEEDIYKITLYICELDGKHSEVEADVTVQFYPEEEIKNMNWQDGSDGDYLYYKLEGIFEKYGLNLKDEIRIVKDYLNSLDTYVDLTVTVRKSNKDKVMEFCKDL
jgi:hypothetical protein